MSNKYNSGQDLITIVSEGIANMANTVNSIMRGMLQIIDNFYVQLEPTFDMIKEMYRKVLFMEIADEIGYPIYMEVDTELAKRLIDSYRENHNRCDKKEMQMIVLDYHKEEYVEAVLYGIKNVHVFKPERVRLIEEGIKAYQLELYAPSASLFVNQLSGMIRDVYKEMNTFHKFSKKEQEEIISEFNQGCKSDSEKSELLQIICCQSCNLVWVKVAQHFLNITFSTKENMKHPQRHMICHGKQTNYNTKEMNLKLILCLDIILELAWRIHKMKEENSVIDYVIDEQFQ